MLFAVETEQETDGCRLAKFVALPGVTKQGEIRWETIAQTLTVPKEEQ